MSVEREPTLEELMAELDAAANGDTEPGSDSLQDEVKHPDPVPESQNAKENSVPSQAPTPTDQSVPKPAPAPAPAVSPLPTPPAVKPEQLVAQSLAQGSENMNVAKKSLSISDTQTEVRVDPPKAETEATDPPQKPHPTPKRQDSSGTGSGSSFTTHLESFWKSAKASAGEILPRKDELSAKVGNMLATAGDSISSAASNVGTAARTRNAKILIKPYASFGVPIELIIKRECGDDAAEQVPAVLEKLLLFLEKNRGVDGEIPLDFFTKPRAAEDRERLLVLRDEIDQVAAPTSLRAPPALRPIRQPRAETPPPLLRRP
jgi:hypothetical protein